MNAKRTFFILLTVLVLLIGLVVGATIGGDIVLKKRSEKLEQLKINSKALDQQELLLLQAKKDIQQYDDLDKISRSVVPQDKDQAKTVQEISSIADQNSIQLKSIDFDASTLGEKAVAPAAGETGAAPASTPNTKPATISQVKPVAGIPGVYSLEIRITSASEVSYKSLIGFLEDLENNRRTANVAKVDFTPNKDGRAIKFIITLNAYIKP